MTDPRTISVYDARAKEYAEQFESAKPGKHLMGFMALLPDGGAVLDLGCGTGGAVAHMVEAGFDVTGMDLSSEMLAIAREKTQARFVQAGFDDLYETAAFDGVWANFSLLHAPREAMPRHLSAIAHALKPKGVFHIGVKTGSGSARDRIDRLYTYYDTDELSDLLTAAGFEQVEVSQGAEAGLAGSVEPWVIVLARKTN